MGDYMVQCNINDQVKFKLTKIGKNVLKEYFEDQRNKYGIDAHELYISDNCDYMKLSLWEFMMVFGPHIHCGYGSLIENNTLVFAN